MAKKKTTVIELRYDSSKPWVEYCRTTVESMVDHYVHNARIEYPGATVRDRKLVA